VGPEAEYVRSHHIFYWAMFQRLQKWFNFRFYVLWCVCWWLYSHRDWSLSCNALIGWKCKQHFT